MATDRIRLPFAEQIAFFRQKLNLPTERWTDIQRSAHDRAFVVAGAQQADLLDDLRQAVDGAIAGGDTLADFRKNFQSIIERRGWADFHGDDRATQGRSGGRALAWRTRTIYQTNVATSYAAGRWQQLNDPALLGERPYWRYIHSDLVSNPRPLHKAWGDSGLTLRHDDPFWLTHFPPNGWGCRCRTKAVRAPASNDATTPPAGWDTRDAKGNLPGVDQGFDYVPGRSSDSLRDMVAKKLITYPPAIAQALASDLARSSVFAAFHAAPMGNFPIAVLPDGAAAQIQAQTPVVLLSSETMRKQLAAHPELMAVEYGQVQAALAGGMQIQDGAHALVYVLQGADGYVAVVKATRTGNAVYLTSFRRLSANAAKRDAEIARLLKKMR